MTWLACTRRFRPDTRVVDGVVAIGLTGLVVFQIAAFRSLPYAARYLSETPGVIATPLAYLLGVGSVLPLAVRRRWPVQVFVAVTVCATLYQTSAYPPAFVVVGPLGAMYVAASLLGGRRAWPLVLVGIGLAAAASALTLAPSEVTTAVVASLGLLSSAALLGTMVRARRELEAEERRAEIEENARRVQEERVRIARELHDIMGHSLTLMTLQADAGAAAMSMGQADKAEAALTVIGDTGRASMRDLRSMLDVLTSADEQSPRAPAADLASVAQLVTSVQEAGWTVTYETTGNSHDVPAVVAISAYRIIQEALTNAVRHSNGTSVLLRVESGPDALVLTVADDGRIRPDAFTEGRGFRGMRERVGAVGGTISIGPDEQGHFRVVVGIPFAKGR